MDAATNTQTFDIETGMDVYDSHGEKVGTVLDIAGFGATKIPRVPAQEPAEFVIQAKTGGGYFNVDRTSVLGADATRLTVPFRGIEDVVEGKGVVLNDTIIHELTHQMDVRPAKVPYVAKKRSRWPKWL